MAIRGLIFDVDGTLAETETIHLAAFNQAFAQSGLDWRWSPELYRELLRVTGGKERMQHYAARIGVDVPRDQIAAIHARKNVLFGEKVHDGECIFRPGVERLIKTAADNGLKLAICTTTSRANVEALMTALLGSQGLQKFAAIVCGEDVRDKKPAPEAYFKSLDRLNLEAPDCLAFEDSSNGLKAALAANIPTIVTPSYFTADESFAGASWVAPDLESFDVSKFALRNGASP